MREPFPPLEALYPLAFKALHAAVYLVGAIVASLVVNWSFRRFQRFTDQLRRDRGSAERVEFEKQSATIATTIRRIAQGLIWCVAVMLMRMWPSANRNNPLSTSFSTFCAANPIASPATPAPASSGATSKSSSFSASNDVVKIDAYSGTVEELTLRTTVLRGMDGATHVISNGSIVNFSNLTRQYAYHVIDLSVDFEADPDRVIAIMREVAAELTADAEVGPLILSEIEILGLDRFAEQGQVLKARIKTLPNQQWKVGREFNRRVLKSLSQAGIGIATAQRVVQYGTVDPAVRAEIKSVVEEVCHGRVCESPTPPH